MFRWIQNRSSLVVSEDLSIKFLVLLLCAFAGVLAPQGMRVVEAVRGRLRILGFLLRGLLVIFLLLGLHDLDDNIVRCPLRIQR